MAPDFLLPLGFGIAASAATLLGGWLALRYGERMTLVLGLAAGVVLGVAFFDLIPEALTLGGEAQSARAMLGCVAIGFAGYLILYRALGSAGRGDAAWRTHLGPASLTLHSFLDGMGIGLAFQVSPVIGWAVALAVLTHDLADGINTVTLSLLTSARATARRWLVANGIAPLAGVALGLVVQVPPSLLAPLLAGFAGVFLFVGACELLPRSHAADPRLRVTLASVAGIALMALVTAVAK